MVIILKRKLILLTLIIIVLIMPSSITFRNKKYYINYSKKYTIISNYQVGLIKILGTSFKEVVVQTTDNSFFLEHDIYGNYSNIGSIFLDYRNSLVDQKLIIYGHNSKQIKEAPFHYLEKFLDEKYSDTHPYLLFETTTHDTYYKLFTVMIVKDNLQHINLNWTSASYYQHLLWLKNNSLFTFDTNITKKDSIIIFQTCYYKPENSYLLLGFKKIAEKKK